jgi:hypothetical protein
VQSFDQELTKANLALAVTCDAEINTKKGAVARDWKKSKPIRVVRSYKLRKFSNYAPAEGFRYDGIYKLVKVSTHSPASVSDLMFMRYFFIAVLAREDAIRFYCVAVSSTP